MPASSRTTTPRSYSAAPPPPCRRRPKRRPASPAVGRRERPRGRLGQELAASVGELPRPREPPVGQVGERGLEPGERRRRREAGVEPPRLRPSAPRCPRRCRRSRRSDTRSSRGAQRLGLAHVERAGRVRPAEPLLRADRVEVGGGRVDGERTDGLRAVDEHRARRSPRAARATGTSCRRATRRPRSRSGGCAGVTWARIRSKTSSARAAPDLGDPKPRSRREQRPGQTEVLGVRGHDLVAVARARARSRRRARPAWSNRSDAMFSAGDAGPGQRAAPRTRSRRSSIASKYVLPPRPCSPSHARSSAIASSVVRASGPNVPAFRYACRSSTGKRARSGPRSSRSRAPRARDPTGAGRRARRRSSGQRRTGVRVCAAHEDVVDPRARAPRTPTPGPSGSAACSTAAAVTLKSPASTTTSSGCASETANQAARSSSASASRSSAA